MRLLCSSSIWRRPRYRRTACTNSSTPSTHTTRLSSSGIRHDPIVPLIDGCTTSGSSSVDLYNVAAPLAKPTSACTIPAIPAIPAFKSIKALPNLSLLFWIRLLVECEWPDGEVFWLRLLDWSCGTILSGVSFDGPGIYRLATLFGALNRLLVFELPFFPRYGNRGRETAWSDLLTKIGRSTADVSGPILRLSYNTFAGNAGGRELEHCCLWWEMAPLILAWVGSWEAS